MTTVVLGWDALDATLLDDYGLASAFGSHHTRLGTFDNPLLEYPHTKEVWPSIVTGQPREVHGVWVKQVADRKEWSNPAIDRASELLSGVLPKSVRTAAGRVLMRAGTDEETLLGPEYYREKGISTVFDGRRARAVSIPNYLTEADRDHGFDLDRSEIFDRIPAGERAEFRPKREQHHIEEVMTRMASARLGVVGSCLQYDYDLVFAWLGYVDTVGHLAPAMDEGGWQERCYRFAAGATREIRDRLDEDDVLVCVSDHGLRDGYHTDDAFLGASDERVVEGVESVLDVRAGIEAVTPSRSSRAEPTVRDPYRCESSVQRESAEEVRARLEDLGYL